MAKLAGRDAESQLRAVGSKALRQGTTEATGSTQNRDTGRALHGSIGTRRVRTSLFAARHRMDAADDDDSLTPMAP